jgi:hypothetical protein
MADAGFTVDAVCPSGHPIARTRAPRRIYPYRGLSPLRSIAAAIGASRPDLLVPGDDLAVAQLHTLHREGGATAALIERSLGAASSFPIVYARAESMAIARGEGVRVPETAVIDSVAALHAWVARVGLPTVLKANGTSGGVGVRVVRTMAEAERAFRVLGAPPLLARAAKRAILDRDTTLVWDTLLRHRSVVNAQRFVEGREATSAVACWNGAVLASLQFVVVEKVSASGPATVLRLIENADMTTAAERMVRRLGLSGLYGFDFMLDEGTGEAHLIEINPRATQACHIPLGVGRDLPAALYAAAVSQPVRQAPAVTDRDTIALFPPEWMRDPDSPYLRSGYHDVPWDEPALMLMCVRARGRLGRGWSDDRWIEMLRTTRPAAPLASPGGAGITSPTVAR